MEKTRKSGRIEDLLTPPLCLDLSHQPPKAEAVVCEQVRRPQEEKFRFLYAFIDDLIEGQEPGPIVVYSGADGGHLDFSPAGALEVHMYDTRWSAGAPANTETRFHWGRKWDRSAAAFIARRASKAKTSVVWLDDVSSCRGDTEEGKATRSREFNASLTILDQFRFGLEPSDADRRSAPAVTTRALLKCPLVWWEAHPGAHGQYHVLEDVPTSHPLTELRLATCAKADDGSGIE